MPVNRFFHDSPLRSSQQVTFLGQEFLHMTRVVKVRKGGSVEIINGKGALAEGVVDVVERSKAIVTVYSVKQYERPPSSIVIAQAIPRLNRLEIIIEKGTELGMSAIWLFPAKKSEKTSFSYNQIERIRYVSICALKQSGGVFLPEILVKPPLLTWKSLPDSSYFGDIDPDAPKLIDGWKETESCCFFIGPESGFTEKEIAFLREHDATGVSLHSNILRTDTAPLVVLSVVYQLMPS